MGQDHQDQNNVIGQDMSQLGLHFEPDKLASSVSYPVTTTFWNLFRDRYLYKSEDSDEEQSKAVQLVIELCYHELGEWEHNTEDTDQGKQDLELAVLLIGELVKSVLERYKDNAD